MQKPSLEEKFTAAWKVIAPGGEPAQIVRKKWPRGVVHQITFPGVHTLILGCDDFVRCLHALEAVAAIIEKQRPLVIGPDGYPIRSAAA